MDWDRIEGNWKQVKGQAQQKWGKLTNDPIGVFNGRRKQLSGKLQETYGISKDSARRQIHAFTKSMRYSTETHKN